MATTMEPMFHSRADIEAGDIVIIFMSRDNMTAIKVTPGESFHNKFGKYKHDDMIGIKFGSKMHSPPPQSGYIHLLRPTPELWTLSLPHRTQILYMPDIAYITMRLGVRVGGKVIEAGTGSGSMTHSMSRAVGPRGTVCSFEYHKARFEKAGEEFEEHGLKNVRLQHRNVCKEGFGDDITDAEAIFLDLPAPWEAIPFAVKALNPDVMTRICCFSPCIEQVTKTASALRAEGFTDVSTQEVLIRTYDLAPPPTVGSNHLLDVSTITNKLREHERRKEERRTMQMRNARQKARELKIDTAIKEGMTREEAEATFEEDDLANATAAGSGDKRKAEGPSDDGAEKKPRVDGDVTEKLSVVDEASNDTVIPKDSTDGPSAGSSSRNSEPHVAWSSMVLTKPSPEMRGHTSYLTFATFYPASIRTKLAAQDIATEPSTRLGTPSVAGKGGRVGELAGDESVAETRSGSEDLEVTGDVVMASAREEGLVAGDV